MSYSYWPGILAPHSSNKASMSWLQIPSMYWDPCSISTLFFVTTPSCRKADAAGRTGRLDSVSTGFHKCGPFTLFVNVFSSLSPCFLLGVFKLNKWNKWCEQDSWLWSEPLCPVISGKACLAVFLARLHQANFHHSQSTGEKQAGWGATRTKSGLLKVHQIPC